MRRPTRVDEASTSNDSIPGRNVGRDTRTSGQRRASRPSIADRVAATDDQLPAPDRSEPKEHIGKGTSSGRVVGGEAEPPEPVVPRMHVRRPDPDNTPQRDGDRAMPTTGRVAAPPDGITADRPTSEAAPPSPRPLVKLTLRIDPVANDFLKNVARVHRMHVTDLVRTALDDWLVDEGHPTLGELQTMSEEQVDALQVARRTHRNRPR